jgi:hypothetical protein
MSFGSGGFGGFGSTNSNQPSTGFGGFGSQNTNTGRSPFLTPSKFYRAGDSLQDWRTLEIGTNPSLTRTFFSVQDSVRRTILVASEARIQLVVDSSVVVVALLPSEALEVRRISYCSGSFFWTPLGVLSFEIHFTPPFQLLFAVLESAVSLHYMLSAFPVTCGHYLETAVLLSWPI